MILITGANGQLGTSFRLLFDKLKINYIATDVNELDITNQEEINKFVLGKNFTHIINCAAYNDVDKAEVDSENCYLLNRDAPFYLSLAAKKINAIFVTYSTDFVFDGEKKSPYKEEDIPNPLSVYAKSKFEGEKKVLENYEKSFIIRTSWLFGKGKNFNTQVLSWIKNNKTLKIVSDLISSPTFTDDLAYFSYRLILTNKFGLYHFSNEGQASKYDQALYLIQKLGKDREITIEKASYKDFNTLAKRPVYSKLDSSKIENIVGEKIPSWQSGIDRWIERYFKNEIE